MTSVVRLLAHLVRRGAPDTGDPTVGVPVGELNNLLRAQVVRGPAALQLNSRFLQFAKHLPGRDDEFWQLLRTWVVKLRAEIDDDTFVANVSAQAKVLSTLVELDRRADADAFVASFGLNLNRFRTAVTADGIVSELPSYGDLPANLFLLTDAQLTVNASITSTRWESGRPVLEGHAFINHIDLATNSTTVSVHLLDTNGAKIEMTTEPVVDERIDELSKHYFADYRPSGFRSTTVAPVPAGEVKAVVTVVTAGVTRTRDVGPLVPASPPVTGPIVSAITGDANILEIAFDRLAPSEVLLVSPRATLRADAAETARFDLGVDGLAPPTGTYELVVLDATGRQVAIGMGEDVDLLLPLARVRTTAIDGRPAIRITAPLRPDERGNRNQQRLRDVARVPRAERDAVFFRALYGEVANCNGRAVHGELVRRGSKLKLFWSVRDRSVAIPEGGIAILEGSHQWHDVVATARYHVINVHQMDWFTKPDGQVMIQTMHGYPYKTMGHDWWAKGDFPAAQVAQFDRRAREWDYFVSPARYATPLLEAAFLEPAAARPEILEVGYPRNDELVTADMATRERVRSALGIKPHQTAVMYAPTFRDYLAVNDMKADAVDFFDASAASQALGPDYVFLMRGHAFNARTDQRGESSPTMIDVTDHPEINDLCLASDAAILDYSSLRFDYALTDKPMVFLVPDLVEWHEARGGVIEYGTTAPGPHATTTVDVVHELADLDALADTWRPAREQFRKDYVDLDDGHASARLVDAVFVPRGDAWVSRR